MKQILANMHRSSSDLETQLPKLSDVVLACICFWSISAMWLSSAKALRNTQIFRLYRISSPDRYHAPHAWTLDTILNVIVFCSGFCITFIEILKYPEASGLPNPDLHRG